MTSSKHLTWPRLPFFLSLKSIHPPFSLSKIMTTTFVHNRSQHSGHRATPDNMSRSSDFSTSNQSTSSSSGRNPVVAAAMSFAGLFAACFTPPEANNSKSLVVDSEEFKSSSGSGNFYNTGLHVELYLAHLWKKKVSVPMPMLTLVIMFYLLIYSNYYLYVSVTVVFPVHIEKFPF